MKDDIEEKKLLLEEHKAKIGLLTDENNMLKENLEQNQRKFEDIYDNHILISKQGEKGDRNHN